MSAWKDWIGKEERRRDIVTAGALDRFAATIGSSPDAIAPPGFHWCLCLPDAPMDALGEDGHPAKGGFMPPIALPRRMWAASSIDFLAPVRVDATVERISTIASATEKSGRSGPLVFVEIDHLVRAGGEDCIRERQTIVYREAATEPLPLPETGRADLSGWSRRQAVTPDPALLFRYSALTFNSHRIHYDLPYAREVEGYPALVVQGPLMATLLMQLAADVLGGRPLGHFSFQGRSPAYADQPLHLLAREEDDGLALAIYGDDGRTVMTADAAPADGG